MAGESIPATVPVESMAGLSVAAIARGALPDFTEPDIAAAYVATIAKLRSLSSPDQVRALLLKEDANVRAGLVPEIQAEAFKPRLDRTLRLRAIRRLQQAKDKPPDVPKAPKRKSKAKPKLKK